MRYLASLREGLAETEAANSALVTDARASALRAFAGVATTHLY
jgi:hypothetical protein